MSSRCGCVRVLRLLLPSVAARTAPTSKGHSHGTATPHRLPLPLCSLFVCPTQYHDALIEERDTGIAEIHRQIGEVRHTYEWQYGHTGAQRGHTDVIVEGELGGRLHL